MEKDEFLDLVELELLSISNTEIRETLIFLLRKSNLSISDIKDFVTSINNHC